LLSDADVLARTGSPLSHQSVAPTIRWLARNEPDIWERTAVIVGSYDYITSRLTGFIGVERNWALESGLFDLRTEEWAPDICEAAGFDTAQMPAAAHATDVVGAITEQAAASTGLRPGTPVIAGSADHVAAALAAGVVDPGRVLVKLGGAGDILLSAVEAAVDERLYLDYHLVPGRWLPNGCMAASGSSIEWFARELAGGTPLKDLDHEAEQTPAGANGIITLPYLLGEKTPIHDPLARGVFFGLHLGHTRGDVFRSLLEAVGYGFRHHFDVFDDLGYDVSTVRVGDGGASSALFTRVISDVLGRTLEPVRSRSGSAVGVAFTAAIGAGLITDWSQIERFVTLGTTVHPDPETRDIYDEGYARYRELYGAIKPVLDRQNGRHNPLEQL
jgi:xylulokinase